MAKLPVEINGVAIVDKAIDDKSSTPASREYYSNRLNELQREKEWLTKER